VQRLSRVPACDFAGYSGVLSTFPFVELRGEEEVRDREVVCVAALQLKSRGKKCRLILPEKSYLFNIR
jgi:hypothetical protein